MVHRDIKPENIMLEGKARRVLLMDFGIAKMMDAAGDSTLTSSGTIVGTPHYMSPEQASGDPHLDHRTDIYSLAVVGYHMLTGGVPFEGENTRAILFKQMMESPRSMRELVPEVPEALMAAVSKGMAKEPSDRYPTIEAFATALENTSTDESKPIVRSPRPGRPRNPQDAAADPGRCCGARGGGGGGGTDPESQRGRPGQGRGHSAPHAAAPPASQAPVSGTSTPAGTPAGPTTRQHDRQSPPPPPPPAVVPTPAPATVPVDPKKKPVTGTATNTKPVAPPPPPPSGRRPPQRHGDLRASPRRATIGTPRSGSAPTKPTRATWCRNDGWPSSTTRARCRRTPPKRWRCSGRPPTPAISRRSSGWGSC